MFGVEIDDTVLGVFENGMYGTPLAYRFGYCPGAFGPSPRSCQSSSRGAFACGCFTIAEGELNDVKSASWAASLHIGFAPWINLSPTSALSNQSDPVQTIR
jgi:hypothetical protein